MVLADSCEFALAVHSLWNMAGYFILLSVALLVIKMEIIIFQVVMRIT